MCVTGERETLDIFLAVVAYERKVSTRDAVQLGRGPFRKKHPVCLALNGTRESHESGKLSLRALLLVIQSLHRGYLLAYKPSRVLPLVDVWSLSYWRWSALMHPYYYTQACESESGPLGPRTPPLVPFVQSGAANDVLDPSTSVPVGQINPLHTQNPSYPSTPGPAADDDDDHAFYLVA
ncbi:hypothetical protein KQX54_021726 [Cotesia glomerata]|uniref:Uncharacterized protein n=1 Tax=Cotesia glomerata TaxID=32391 RepID=A0AAV7J7C5_COTGL|nr:hypothetical protein KQX54_021726 [Cotesia glomerata]